MMEHGELQKMGAGYFEWIIDDVLSLKCARSPPFKFLKTHFHLRISANEREDRLELSIHTMNVLPRETFEVKFKMNTGNKGEPESRTGIIDAKGNFFIRKWMPWTEMLERRLMILRDGRLRVTCLLWKVEEMEESLSQEDSDCSEDYDEEDTLKLPKSENENAVLEDNDSREESDEEETLTLPKCFRELIKSLKSLLISKENSDVTIRVQGKEFPAHKCILGMRCPAFESMFKHDMKEKKSGVVDIDDCDPEIFPDFLTHLYTGRISHVTSKNVFALYSVSDKYGLGELKDACLEFMELNIDCENFCSILSLALHHGENELISTTTEFFCGCAQEIVETKEWQVFLANNPTAGNELFRKALMKKK